MQQKNSYKPIATASGLLLLLTGFGMFPKDIPLRVTLTVEANPVPTRLAPVVSEGHNKYCVPDKPSNSKPSEEILIALLPMEKG
jgi:hypothetical protein